MSAFRTAITMSLVMFFYLSSNALGEELVGCTSYYYGSILPLGKLSSDGSYAFAFDEVPKVYTMSSMQGGTDENVQVAELAFQENRVVYAAIDTCQGMVVKLSLNPEPGRKYIFK